MPDDRNLNFVFVFLLGVVDTLFRIFCECAELNPEPMEGGCFGLVGIIFIG